MERRRRNLPKPHARQQTELVDAIAERIRLLGGVSVAIAHDLATAFLRRLRTGTHR